MRNVWIIFILISTTGARAQTELSEIVVKSNQQAGQSHTRSADIQRVEVRRREQLEQKPGTTFTDALANERGVDAQTSCAFCGTKRVSINGLRGEHTTVLVDGLPLHSNISSFYGLDTIPLESIDEIEVRRGTGNAQAAPDSIGGTLNLVTREPLNNQVSGRMSWGWQDGQRNAAATLSHRLSQSSGLLLSAQTSQTRPLDLDKNQVSEVPAQGLNSVMAKWTQDWSEVSQSSLRLSYGRLLNLGGSLTGAQPRRVASTLATPSNFADQDVRKLFGGSENQIADWIQIERWESAWIHRYHLASGATLKLALGAAIQWQDSVYSHGYDYRNRDQVAVGLAEYQKALSEQHLMTLTVDSKNEQMRSQSDQLYMVSSPPLRRDDLTFHNLAVSVQDMWTLDDANEISTTLRVDAVRTEWTDLGRRVQKVVPAPRLAWKHIHNAVFTSRMAYGLGYRSPLTLFESQHGSTHDGFEVQITDVERAHSFVYSLTAQRENDFFEAGIHSTLLSGLAYGQDRDNQSLPTLFVNSPDTYSIWAFDFTYGRRWTANWNTEATFEMYEYPRGYKDKLPVAAIEKRLTLLSNLNWGKWRATQKLTVVGPRDLAAYGYDHHFNIADLVISSPTYGQGLAPKMQSSPWYATVDLSIEREVGSQFYVGLNVTNIFNYTQTGYGDSPLMWNQHGDHFHLDNLHIWGPLRGRQIFLTARGTFD